MKKNKNFKKMSLVRRYYLYTDGASRNNPGKSGGGSVLYNKDMDERRTTSKYYGIKTNNESEYLALIDGLKSAKKYLKRKNRTNVELIVRLDSNLIVQHMNGNWRAKKMRPYYLKTKKIVDNLLYHIQFEHVRRHLNTRADELANDGIDNHEYLEDN